MPAARARPDAYGLRVVAAACAFAGGTPFTAQVAALDWRRDLSRPPGAPCQDPPAAGATTCPGAGAAHQLHRRRGLLRVLGAVLHPVVGLSATRVGLALTIGWCTGMLAGVPLGTLADRSAPAAPPDRPGVCTSVSALRIPGDPLLPAVRDRSFASTPLPGWAGVGPAGAARGPGHAGRAGAVRASCSPPSTPGSPSAPASAASACGRLRVRPTSPSSPYPSHSARVGTRTRRLPGVAPRRPPRTDARRKPGCRPARHAPTRC